MARAPVVVGFCMCAVGAGILACGSRPKEERPPARIEVTAPEISLVGVPVPIANRPAPDIRAATASGGRFVLSEHRGSVVVVNFWATWCAPCIVETPMLEEISTTMQDSGVVVLGIALDREGFDVVRPFVDRFKVGYPVILDHDIADSFGGAYVLPTTFFVDRRGYIVSRVNGLLHEDVLRSELRRLM